MSDEAKIENETRVRDVLEFFSKYNPDSRVRIITLGDDHAPTGVRVICSGYEDTTAGIAYFEVLEDQWHDYQHFMEDYAETGTKFVSGDDTDDNNNNNTFLAE